MLAAWAFSATRSGLEDPGMGMIWGQRGAPSKVEEDDERLHKARGG
jgi:hypothetical protein